MNKLAPLTESEVKQLVVDWYLKLDVHATVEELLPQRWIVKRSPGTHKPVIVDSLTPLEGFPSL